MDGLAKTGWCWLVTLCCLLAACGKQGSDAVYAPVLIAPPHEARVAEYTFGVTPMSNFRDVYDVFQPVIDYLNAGLPDARLVLEVPRGLAEHEQQLEARTFAFALSNPYHSWRAARRSGYRIIAKMGDDAAFRGIWVVRKGSAIRTLADLKGKKLCFPPKSALAATMMTQLQLKQAGIDPARDVHVNYVGSQHASIMEVYMKGADAGATWPLAWATFQRTHPEQARELEVRFPTDSLINQGIVARNDVPPELVTRVERLMAEMHDTEQGRALLAQVPITRFEPASDADYDVVQVFLDKYKQAFPDSPDALR
ncbi:phosphate/phosphite/phosphonate ABC transporter substrate-binding protein [Massilia sp. CF038]|uniref:phosphate/phosphite/phosphonate ABC transporter substrate-binding protein n=1 Tax=Massilia sp. CF038 TaxID=1881045 RepID=UPI0009125EC3|nr:phosphate/phosphite/phosphonate ABC transporter substrate-binding protein [Massilia sp. CF038]SHH24033.1 phosphonate transport system substrate-binding protein [Massilia sp. CF038]